VANNLLPGWQSTRRLQAWQIQVTYRQFQSTETAVMNVFNDLLMAADRGRYLFSVSLICQLPLILWIMTYCCNDLNVSFACVAECSGGSLMSGRTFHVMYGNVMSFTVYVTCSVPKSSVLGPLFFILHIMDLADWVAKYGVCLHAYAVYLHFWHNEIASSVGST